MQQLVVLDGLEYVGDGQSVKLLHPECVFCCQLPPRAKEEAKPEQQKVAPCLHGVWTGFPLFLGTARRMNIAMKH